MTHPSSPEPELAGKPTPDELRAVREKIASGWTRGSLARNRNGHVAKPEGDEAVCWCLSGAAYAVRQKPEWLARKLGFASARAMARWNDSQFRQADILARIDAALAREANAPELRHV